MTTYKDESKMKEMIQHLDRLRKQRHNEFGPYEGEE